MTVAYCLAGTSIPPKAMMHFPPVSYSPLFSENLKNLWKSFKILRFPKKILNFHPPKLVIDHKFRISPLFQYIFPPVSRKLLFLPCFYKVPLCLRKIHLLFHALCVFRFPPTLTMMHLCITQCTYTYCCLVYIPVLITQNRFLLTLDQLFSYLYIIKIDGEFK